MCGRVNVSDNEGVRVLLESLGMSTWPSREPRFNIAPTQTLNVVRMESELSLQAMSAVHDRMPVLLLSANEAMAWLQESDRESLDALMKPASNDALVLTEVDSCVNNSRHEGPECIQPVASQGA